MTAEQLDLLTVAGLLDLNGLEQLQQRLDDMPGQRARRVRHERHRAEPSAALDFRAIVGSSAPDPAASEITDAPGCVGHDHRGGNGGPSCAPAGGT
jgi:hypothetical protein